MNGQLPRAFEDKKPVLAAAGSSKDPPTLLEPSSPPDPAFYSALHGSQDLYAAQQPYPAQHMNPYGYHHYGLNGMGPSGPYKVDYPLAHGAIREHGAFCREAQTARQENGELTTCRLLSFIINNTVQNKSKHTTVISISHWMP